MIEPGEIRTHLIDRLAAIFGTPKNAASLADELAKHTAPGVTPAQLNGLAEHLIATRKTKGFPSAGELIASVKAIQSAGAGSAHATEDGTIRFDGAVPVTWVPADDPRFKMLCDMEVAVDKKRRYVGATTSKYAPGLGWFFPNANVDALPLTDTERHDLRAQRDPRGIVDRVASGMKAFGRQLRQSIETEPPVSVAPGEGPCARALREAVQVPEKVAVNE